MSEIVRRLLVRLWWGRGKRASRAILRRLMRDSAAIKFGPLSGCYFEGNYPQRLGIYEMPTERAINENLSPRQVFYDIGANNGYFTLLASKICGENGHVYSFEPVPDNFQILQKNTASMSNCSLVQKGVSSSSSAGRMFVGDGVKATLAHEEKDTISVDLITLDDFTAFARYPNLIKIDVEGAEAAVLTGGRKLLSRPDAPTLIIEVHDEVNDRKILADLKNYEYRIARLQNQLWEKPDYPYHVIAQKNSRPRA